ncbi:MAG TPA: hypothetical protein VFN50_08130 [Acidimicrobiales bacterium]|nr:hypothetical protein [Acidimicrobiales bacterium]
MTWFFVILPAMLLALAAAVVPVLVTMVRDERERRAAAQAAADRLRTADRGHGDVPRAKAA